jgi:uncharacterized membrane protein
MKNQKIQKISLTAIFTALVFCATYFIAIPMPAFGYVNVGDAFVLLSVWFLGPIGFICAGVGSALADLLLGYAIYAPATFVIKALMAIASFFIFKALKIFKNNTLKFIISSLVAELIMVLGYFLFEGILYGFAPSALNIPFNLVQGALSLAISNIVINILLANKTTKKFILIIE